MTNNVTPIRNFRAEQDAMEAAHEAKMAERAARPKLPLSVYYDILEVVEESGNLTPDHFSSRELRDKAEGAFGLLRSIARKYGEQHEDLFHAFVAYAAYHGVPKPERPTDETLAIAAE